LRTRLFVISCLSGFELHLFVEEVSTARISKSAGIGVGCGIGALSPSGSVNPLSTMRLKTEFLSIFIRRANPLVT
jgi:hypothetical protein